MIRIKYFYTRDFKTERIVNIVINSIEKAMQLVHEWNSDAEIFEAGISFFVET